MKGFNYALLFVFTALMIWASMSLPGRGDPQAPAHRDVNVVGGPVAGAYFIENAMSDAATPNIVTVVLADYRSIDTMGEVVVVFTAGMACYLILRRRDDD